MLIIFKLTQTFKPPGGAQGIGAAVVSQLFDLGAHVIFGDWLAEKGEEVAKSVSGRRTSRQGSVHFQQVDVRNHASQVALFDTAYKLHGTVDVAIACAGVIEPRGWFEPEDLDMESVRKEPVPVKDNIDINLTSVILFSRIALAFMKESSLSSTTANPVAFNGTSTFSKSIVLVSSIAGITEAPGLFAYSSAKHGVIGLMRALRPWAPKRFGVRANAICPWATDTQLLAGVRQRWVDERMPMNQPDDVARMIIQCAADGNMNGQAVYVAGGRGFDTEEGINKTLPQWMGEENAAVWLKGQQVLGLVSILCRPLHSMVSSANPVT
jgi:NAD(P)-dependent dehydrogenase (short-subunit alcohol dehydrogenase family)